MANSSTRSSANVWDRLKPLPKSFYSRDTVQVAKELLGKVLVVDSRGKTAMRIVETEAYHGDDPASHSARGKTPRNSIMFGEPGVAYVYFIYGTYEMLNFVTEKKGYPGAVLIRAGEPLFGQSLMKRRRGPVSERNWTNGPGRLCRAMGVRLSHNGESLQGPAIRVVDDGFKPPSISSSPRVGITLGTETPWRFFITGNPDVSKTPFNRVGLVLK